MRNVAAALVALASMSLIPVNQTQSQWAQTNGPYGGFVQCFAVSGSNLFAGDGLNGGVYLSTNSGTSWTAVNTGLTNHYVLALTVSGTNLFAGTNGAGVFLSTNNGTSWSPVNSGLTNTYPAALAVSGANLFAGTSGGGVFLSTNSGTSWTHVSSGLSDTNVVCFAVSGSNLFAGTLGGGVFRSTNSGTSWTVVDSGLTNTHVQAFTVSGSNLFAGTAGGGVFKSTNSGTNWAPVNTGLTNLNIQALAANGTNLFAGTYSGGVFRSTNSGATWTAVIAGLTNNDVQALAVSVGGTVLFSGTNGGVFLSTNSGTSWTAANTGMTNTDVRALAASGTNLFAGSDGSGVFLSTNSGTNWSQVNTGLTNTNVRALAVSGTNLFAGTNGSGVFLSTNTGTSWTRIDSGFTFSEITALAVTGTNLFAGTFGAGVYRSTNSGTIWTHVTSGLTDTNVYSLMPGGTNLFAGTLSGGVYRSTNSGTTWTAVIAGLTNTDVRALVVSGTNLFAGTWGGGVYLSTNNGTNWTQVNAGLTNHFVDAFAVSGTNLFAGTFNGGVFLSSNNGTSWTALPAGLTNNNVQSLSASATNLFAGTYGSAVFSRPINQYAIVASTDGHGTISPPGSVNVVYGVDRSFTITPDFNFRIDSVIADGVRVDSTTSYTFQNVTAGHTIRATFLADSLTISGMVFNDLNGNGVKEAGDTGLVNWKVSLKDLSDTILDSTATDTGGHYLFSQLAEGSYTVSERLQDDWIQTSPSGLGTHAVTIAGGGGSGGNDFGNVPGIKFVNPSGGIWSVASNWQGNQLPGATTPAIIPASVTVTFDLSSGVTILSLRVRTGGRLTAATGVGPLRVTRSVLIDPGGKIEFPIPSGGGTDFLAASDSEGITVYGDFIDNGTFDPGHSIVKFAGNRPKIISSTKAETPGGANFYGLDIAGDSVSAIGNLTVTHQLTLGYGLKQRLQDTITITNDSTTAMLGNGTIPAGSIKRKIRQAERGAYRFETTNSYLKFDGTGTYPSNVNVTTLPDTAPPSFKLRWQLVGGVANPLQNTIKAGSVSHFSRWAMGLPRPLSASPISVKDTSQGIPVVNREYEIKPEGGSGFRGELQLRYEQTEVPPATDESALQLLRGPFISDTVLGNWNMVSLPLKTDEDRKDSLFPAASGPAFAYEGGYVLKPNLRFGQGYWLRFPSTQSVQVLGNDVGQESVAVSVGWNLIGTVSFPMAAASVGSTPPRIITSHFFGYGGGYQVADTLRPLRGYWVKTTAGGQLTLEATGSFPKARSSSPPLERFSSLLFRDATGSKQRLYFGSNANVDVRQFELPPPPPEGMFDVRFSTQRMLEVSEQKQSKSIPILISSAVYPVVVQWTVQDTSDQALLRADGKSVDLNGDGKTQFTDAATQLHLILLPASAGELPREFALEQNYPNPFNPVTVIRYQLPVASDVTLRIYNLLGQEVTTLVNGMQDAGFKSAEWEAAGIAGGVYFYRMEATSSKDPSRSFTQVRKMLFVR